jgi:hypothetical protein
MGILDTLFGGGQQAGYGKLQESLEQGLGQLKQFGTEAQGFLSPFRTGGQTALQQALQRLAPSQDPTAMIQNIQSRFQQSPAQRFAQQQATEAAQNQLAAQGISGSGAAAQELAQRVAGITGQQEQQNLQNVLGLRQQDLGSLLGISQLGAGAAGQAAQGAFGEGQDVADLMGAIGQARAGGAEARASGISNLFGTLLGNSIFAPGATSQLGSALGSLGGGAAAGGAAGAAGGAGGLGALAGL